MGTAELLDKAHSSFEYSSAVYAQQAKVDDSTLTPSGLMMAQVEAGLEFTDIVAQEAERHKIHFASIDKDTDFHENLAVLAEQSIREQRDLEAADSLSFEEYLVQYNDS